jgi:glycosyltransferase involved in cell wall biosynthesis
MTLRLAHHLSDRMVTSLPSTYRYRKGKLVVIGQGIDTEKFAPSKTPQRGAPQVLCAGRLSPVKDHSTLLKAVASMSRARKAPFQLTILGDPARASDENYATSLKELSRRLGIETLVRFVPGVPPAEMPAWYRKCHVHVNMTPAGFGDKVALEAMACGRPCITANTDFRETLGRFTPALLYRHGNEEDLFERLSAILDKPEKEVDQIGGYLREQIVRLHGLESLADRIVRMLQTLRDTTRSA